VIASDVVNYYGYLPAVFIYQDASLMYWDDLDFDLQLKLCLKPTKNKSEHSKCRWEWLISIVPYFW